MRRFVANLWEIQASKSPSAAQWSSCILYGGRGLLSLLSEKPWAALRKELQGGESAFAGCWGLSLRAGIFPEAVKATRLPGLSMSAGFTASSLLV